MAEAALVSATHAGIHCLPVPTPFAVGAVNTYLLEGEPLTLVDCGPNSATSLVRLERLLAAHGYELADLEVLVVTHQHLDHFGLASVIAERSGAEVACLDLVADYLLDWGRNAAADDDHAHELMLHHGIEQRVATALHELGRRLRGWGAPVPVTRTLAAGETVHLGGRDLRVLHRPGHSPSDTLLHDEARGIVIAGDHLLSRVSSNALITRPLEPGWDGRRPQPLVAYRESLLATREMDVTLVLGGHDAAVTEHRALIDRRLEEQRERAAKLHGILAAGPRSAHELATALWGEVAITQAYLTLSEVLGHLDLLIEDGRVAEQDDGRAVLFEAIA